MARELSIEVTANTSQAEQALGRVEGAVQGVEQAADGSTTAVDEQSKALDRSSESAGRANGALTALLARIGGPLGVATAFVAANRAMMQYSDRIDDMSRRTGIGAVALQKFEFLAKTNETTLAAVARAAQRLGADLSQGDKSAVAGVQRLGFNVQALLAMNAEDRFVAVGRAIGSIEDPAKRAAAAEDILKRSGIELIGVFQDLANGADTYAPAMGEAWIQAGGTMQDAFNFMWEHAKNFALYMAFSFPKSMYDGWMAWRRVWGEAREWFGAAMGNPGALPTVSAPDGFGGIPGGLAGLDPDSAEYKSLERELTQDARASMRRPRSPGAGRPAVETWTPHPLFDRADLNAWSVAARGPNMIGAPGWRPFQNPQLLVPTTDWQPPMAAYPGAVAMNAPGDAAYAAARPNLARRVGGDASSLLAELGPNVLGAIQGGGSVTKTIGATMLGGLVSGGSALGGAVSKGISGALGSTIGAALGSVVPVLGTLLGGAVGGMVGKLFGGGEAGKTQKARAGFLDEQGGFEELKRVADEVGFSLDKMMDTRRVQDFETEVRRLNDAMREHAEDAARVPEAMERWGLTLEQAGLKFQQSEMNKGFKELGDDFRVLLGAGFDFDLVAERMAPAMGALIHTSIEMGTQVPRELEPIIAKMIELGVLTDKNGEAFTELAQVPFAESLTQGFDRLATVLNAILVQLGGVAVGFDQAAGAAANFNGVAGGVNVTLPVGSPTPLEDGPIDVVEMARGGLVLGRGQVQYFDAGGMVRNLWDRDRAYADFAPRGSDTVPAMLTPGEMVLSREMVRDLSEARHSTMPVGDRARESTAGRSGDTHVVIIKTSSIGEVMAQLPQHIALNGEVRYKLSRVLADG